MADKSNNVPQIIDNNRNDLLSVFKTIASNYNKLSIATGYWDIKGMLAVYDDIKHFDKIRLLIGREPLIPRHKRYKPELDYPDKDIFDDLEQMQPTNELKSLVSSIKKLIEEKKLEVRVYRKNFLHAKCYIFGDYSSENAIGIIGSSNFTKSGLTHNTELNALEDDHRIVTYKPQSEKQEVGHLFWFDQFWDYPTTEVWNGEFTELISHSPVGDTLFSPYETYIKTLHDLYREELEEEDIDKSIKGSHDLYDFQTKNVHALVRRLKKYKVAMLADSVGLGKTYTAIEVIKQYLTGEEGQRRVEIICPKSLVTQWQSELATQGVFNLTPITLQNPRIMEERSKLDDIASVSLFVIDESHNLKNRGGKRYQQIIDWITKNNKAHVLLLTATPINNQIKDIVDQILLGTRGEGNILKVTAIDKRARQTVQIDFYQAIDNLQKKIKQDLTRDGKIDYEYIRQIMSPILRAFVVRRTRQGIQKEYGSLVIDGKEQKFPVVMPEIKRYGFDRSITQEILKLEQDGIDLSNIYKYSPDEIVENTRDLLHPLNQVSGLAESYDDKKLSEMSAIHFVYQIVLLLGFLPYRWRMYKTKYYGKTRLQIKEMRLSGAESKLLFLQLSIYGILRTVFLKRLESSVKAFRSSLETYKRKISVFERGLDAGKIVSLKDLTNIEEQLLMGDEDFDPDEILIDEEYELDDVDDKKYALDELRNDIEIEKSLIDLLDKQLALLEKDDSKITAFAELLQELDEKKPAGSKVLVFSFYADTVDYLREVLPQYANFITESNTAFLSSKNRKDADSIAGRFAPKAKKYNLQPGETELNYLFSTDILSEGQNLQDCGILVNYDLHWNPVRMIQRNGRINRIGTEYPEVNIYNINPEAQLEEYLRLVQRLEGKINLIKNTIGTDTPVLDEEENPIEFTDSWKDIYSDSLQDRIKALEQAEKDSDLLLSEDEYISDLKVFDKNPEFSDNYREKIYGIPKGKWALMPHNSSKGDKKPEVLVMNCFRDENGKPLSHAFVSMKKSGDAFQAQLNLQALEWLKTTPEDNNRCNDHISIDKQLITKNAEEKSTSYQEEDTGNPIGQQNDVLRIMFELHFTEDDFENVRAVFQTSNVLRKQEVNKLVRRIMQAKRENTSNIEYIQQLVAIAITDKNKPNEEMNYDHVTQSLFYVEKNE